VIKKEFFPYKINADIANNNKKSNAQKAALPPIMLLHGWGLNSRIWQTLIPEFQQMTDVITIDVSYAGANVDRLCCAVVEEVDKPVILLGWSLGGMLAAEIASRYPNKTLALMTLASNVKFVTSNQWPYGMCPNTYYPFYNDVESDYEKTIKHFMSLVALGDKYATPQRKYLHSLLASDALGDANYKASKEHWLEGLKLLNNLDTQKAIGETKCPALHVYGGKDNVVPIDAAKNIQQLNTDHEFAVIPDAGHCLMLPKQRLFNVIQPFLNKVLH